MDRFVVTFLVLCAISVGVVVGQTTIASGYCAEKMKDCIWYLYSNGTLSISGEKIMDYLKNGAPWYGNRSIITDIVVRPGMEKIGDNAFYQLTEVETCSLPTTLTKMGKSVFLGCTKLQSIVIPRVEKIKRSCFYGCTALSSVYIYYGVTEIQAKSFYGCSSLTSIAIPGSVQMIDFNAFKDCTSLENVTIKAGVQEISEGAFKGCTSLQTVTMLGNLTTIDDCAFEGCTALTTVSYYGTVDPYEMGEPFKDCSSLNLLCIPRYYDGDSFCNKPVYPNANILIDDENHCYEAMICSETEGFIVQRKNVTTWESETESCFSHYCDNETGPSLYTKCNSTSERRRVCAPFENYEPCFEFEEDRTFKRDGWTVVLSFNSTGVDASHLNVTEITAAAIKLGSVPYGTSVSFASEIDPSNYLQNVYLTTTEDAADTLKTKLEAVIADENCSYGIICDALNVSIIEGYKNKVSGASHSFVSLFLLFLTIIVSLVSSF